MSWYFLSVGSNVDAQRSMSICLRKLVGVSATTVAYPCRWTSDEEGTGRQYVNTLVAAHLSIEIECARQTFARIESELGRTRELGCSGEVVCDIDIITVGDSYEPLRFREAKLGYHLAIINGVGAVAEIPGFPELSIDGTTAIYLDHGSGNKCIR